MKKFFKKIVGFIALFLIVGGILVLMWQYFRNKQLFEVLLNNSVVKGSMVVLKKMAIALVAVIVGLVISSVYFKLGSSIRKDEKIKKLQLKEQQEEQERLNKELKKEAETLKAENEQMKESLQVQEEKKEEVQE